MFYCVLKAGVFYGGLCVVFIVFCCDLFVFVAGFYRVI